MLAGKAKKVKDPNAPKKPLTTYMRYAATVRAGIREENPDFKVFVCIYIVAFCLHVCLHICQLEGNLLVRQRGSSSLCCVDLFSDIEI